MITRFSRRGFLAATAAVAAATILPRSLRAESAALQLRATSRTIEVQGRAATVFGLLNEQGGQGLILDPGQRFAVDLTNELDVTTIIHWHGQIPPNAQDGVPDAPLPLLQPGERRGYDFDPAPGTHWMHSHVPVQEMQLLAAPLIVRRPEDLADDRQEAVMFLHDFSFRPAEEVLAEIRSGVGHAEMPTEDMDHSSMDNEGRGSMPGMAMGEMDLNDFEFDAYLVNDRTLDDPEAIRVEQGGRVLLRVINAAAATNFWIDCGALSGRLVAVDGQPVAPLSGARFGLSMGQRLDIELDLPSEGGAWPILALREGAHERTGLFLHTDRARIPFMSSSSDTEAPPFDLGLEQESRLRAVNALPDRGSIQPIMAMLGGGMQPYVWTINGRTWGEHVPLNARSGERVEIMFHNMSMMGHPMHLHGHHFQVVGINGQRLAGAMRDTVYVPPMARVTIALDAGEAANWMLHCHHMPHLSTGMMTEFVVAA